MTKINVKKTAAAIVIVFIMLFLTACSKDSADASGSSAQAANGEFATGKQGQKSNPQSAAYEVVKQTYTDRNVKINYPQVANMSDSKKQEKINELIKSEALEAIKGYSQTQMDNLYWPIDYEITLQTPDILSVKFSGVRNLKGAAHPTNELFTTLINTQEGKKIRLNDIIKIDNKFTEKMIKGKMIAASPEIKLEMLRLTSDKLIEALKTADSRNEDENEYHTYSYFTQDSLVVSIEVGHAYGDHTEFEIRYQDLTNSVNSDNQLWKSVIK